MYNRNNYFITSFLSKETWTESEFILFSKLLVNASFWQKVIYLIKKCRGNRIPVNKEALINKTVNANRTSSTQLRLNRLFIGIYRAATITIIVAALNFHNKFRILTEDMTIVEQKPGHNFIFSYWIKGWFRIRSKLICTSFYLKSRSLRLMKVVHFEVKENTGVLINFFESPVAMLFSVILSKNYFSAKTEPIELEKPMFLCYG